MSQRKHRGQRTTADRPQPPARSEIGGQLPPTRLANELHSDNSCDSAGRGHHTSAAHCPDHRGGGYGRRRAPRGRRPVRSGTDAEDEDGARHGRELEERHLLIPRRGRVRAAVETLNPGYFALVMATGIVSIAMNKHHAGVVSAILLSLAITEYAILVVLSGWRLTAFRSAVAADLADPRRAFGLFTFVAATDVVGTRLTVADHKDIALVLLAVGWVAWLVLGYVVPWTAGLRHARRPVLQDANGTWFIWVVASQSIAVLSAALEPSVSGGRRELALLAVFSWAVGVFLYAAAGIFVGARMLLYPLGPDDLTPPYWVAMGATAITVVAGARIVQMADAPMVEATRGLIAGASVIFWAFGSWLIPPLIAAGIWRHGVHHLPLRYEAPLWSVIFPLGMYGVGGQYLGQADRLPIVEAIGANESWVALAAWLATFLAMLYHLGRTLVRAPAASPASEPANP